MDIQLRIPEEQFPSFLAYLGIGTLYAIRSGTVPPKTGIWTLARPKVWDFLLQRPNIPKSIVEVFQTADELSGIQTLLPDQFDAKVEKLIQRLQAELAKMKDPTWSIEWDTERKMHSTSRSPSRSLRQSHASPKRQKKKKPD